MGDSYEGISPPFLLIAVAVVAAIALALVLPAQAQNRITVGANCWPRTIIVEHLAEKFNETVVSRGIIKRGNGVLEVLAGKNGSWTALISMPNGISCMVATGRAWENVPAAPKKLKGVSL